MTGIALICPVRGCGQPLVIGATAAACERGHSFDRAREGYISLLQPQDRRSPTPGDSAGSVSARHRWLETGRGEPLAVTIGEAIDRLAPPRRVAPPPPGGARVLDLGCGDGWFTTRLARGREWRACGVDLSTAALRLAASRTADGSSLLWIAANADRPLPFPDASFDLVLSLFGRRPAAECRRLLRAGGRWVVAVPGEDDLRELREAALGRAERLSTARPAGGEPGFTLLEEREHRSRVALDASAARDALAMTYRGARRREQDRLAAGPPPAEATVSALIRVYATSS